MKKNYFSTLFVALMLFVAMPAWADATSASDLFGKYKFSAEMEVIDNSYADKFTNDCEVIISKASVSYYAAEIRGLAGLGGYMIINDLALREATQVDTILVLNPNNNIGGEKLYMSDITGKMNIYTGDSTQYSLDMYYDPTTKNITLPDFSLVTKTSDHKAGAVVAKFTNAKLILVEAEVIEVADLSGDWHFKAVTGSFNTNEESTLPTEWDMTLTSTNESNSTYDISLTLGDFAPLALTAKFDGNQLTIPFDETYFDAENKIGLADMYGDKETRRTGSIVFNLANENLLSLYSGMTIAQDSISPDVKGGFLQWYMVGSAKRGSEGVTESWAGSYKIKGSVVDVTIADYTYPEEFDMEVVYYEESDMYLITNILGLDVAALNYGGIPLTPSEDEPNKAEIATGKALLSIEPGVKYLYLMDDDVANSSLEIVRNEDGTYTVSNFSITEMTYDENWNQKHEFAVAYENVTAEKYVEEFSWANTFSIKVPNVTVYNETYAFPAEFEIEVQYFEDANWAGYLVTKIFGNDVTALNYGGIDFTPSEKDPYTAELKTGGYLKTIESGVSYLCLKDANLGDSPLTITRLEDGTITISDFCVTYMTYDENWNQNHEKVALYSQETAETFSWANTFSIKVPNVTVYNETYAFPAEFEMEVQYFEEWGIYLVTKMFGNDVTALNYGGIDFTPSEKDPYTAELKTGGYLKTIESGVSYLCLKDANLGDSPLTITRLEDGTITISDFCVTYMTYDENWNQNHEKVALYSQKGAGIEDVVVEGAVEGIFDIFGRKLDTITAPGLYIVNGNKVLVK